jgi:hypothetical protein
MLGQRYPRRLEFAATSGGTYTEMLVVAAVAAEVDEVAVAVAPCCAADMCA